MVSLSRISIQKCTWFEDYLKREYEIFHGRSLSNYSGSKVLESIFLFSIFILDFLFYFSFRRIDELNNRKIGWNCSIFGINCQNEKVFIFIYPKVCTIRKLSEKRTFEISLCILRSLYVWWYFCLLRIENILYFFFQSSFKISYYFLFRKWKSREIVNLLKKINNSMNEFISNINCQKLNRNVSQKLILRKRTSKRELCIIRRPSENRVRDI